MHRRTRGRGCHVLQLNVHATAEDVGVQPYSCPAIKTRCASFAPCPLSLSLLAYEAASHRALCTACRNILRKRGSYALQQPSSNHRMKATMGALLAHDQL